MIPVVSHESLSSLDIHYLWTDLLVFLVGQQLIKYLYLRTTMNYLHTSQWNISLKCALAIIYLDEEAKLKIRTTVVKAIIKFCLSACKVFQTYKHSLIVTLLIFNNISLPLLIIYELRQSLSEKSHILYLFWIPNWDV